MPAYDFRCTSCEATFEIVRSISDTSAVTCPECDAPAKRVFTPVGVHFKGSGFYNTDSRAKSKGSAASDAPKTEKPASSAGSCSASGSSPACAGCAAAE